MQDILWDAGSLFLNEQIGCQSVCFLLLKLNSKYKRMRTFKEGDVVHHKSCPNHSMVITGLINSQYVCRWLEPAIEGSPVQKGSFFVEELSKSKDIHPVPVHVPSVGHVICHRSNSKIKMVVIGREGTDYKIKCRWIEITSDGTGRVHIEDFDSIELMEPTKARSLANLTV